MDTSYDDFDRRKTANDNRLKSAFESIFAKYDHDFTGVGDEIDLETGTIVVDNGHLQNLGSEFEEASSELGDSSGGEPIGDPIEDSSPSKQLNRELATPATYQRHGDVFDIVNSDNEGNADLPPKSAASDVLAKKPRSSLGSSESKRSRNRTPWTVEEDNCLSHAREFGYTFEDIQAHYLQHRHQGVIRNRWLALRKDKSQTPTRGSRNSLRRQSLNGSLWGIGRGYRTSGRWKPAEDQLLRDLMAAQRPVRECADHFPLRSLSAVQQRRSGLLQREDQEPGSADALQADHLDLTEVREQPQDADLFEDIEDVISGAVAPGSPVVGTDDSQSEQYLQDTDCITSFSAIPSSSSEWRNEMDFNDSEDVHGTAAAGLGQVEQGGKPQARFGKLTSVRYVTSDIRRQLSKTTLLFIKNRGGPSIRDRAAQEPEEWEAKTRWLKKSRSRIRPTIKRLKKKRKPAKFPSLMVLPRDLSDDELGT